MLRQRSKTKKVSHQINKGSFLLASNWRMEELCQTTTFKRNQPFILCSDFEVVCKFLLRRSQAKPLRLKLRLATLSKMLRQRFRTRKAFLQISNVSYLLENNWKMDVPFQITIFKRSLHFIWYFAFEEATKFVCSFVKS